MDACRGHEHSIDNLDVVLHLLDNSIAPAVMRSVSTISKPAEHFLPPSRISPNFTETTQHSRWSKITKEIAIAPVTSLADSNLIFLLAEFESLAVVIVEVRGTKSPFAGPLSSYLVNISAYL